MTLEELASKIDKKEQQAGIFDKINILLEKT